jgi:hypothetical protein
VRDYLSEFLTEGSENQGALKDGNRQNHQKPPENVARSLPEQPTKPSKGAFVGSVGTRSKERARISAAPRPPAPKIVKTPGGALTTARCHEGGCNGRLKVDGLRRRCSVCGAEIKRFLFT